MNFDPVAPFYRFLEHMVFGSKLQRARVAHLEFIEQSLVVEGRVLLLGDGDGRFLVELLKCRKDLQVDYLEKSAVMLEKAKKNVEATCPESTVKWHCMDVREWNEGGYNLIVSHFFLDCFNAEELEKLIPSLRSKLKPDGRWLVSDFNDSVSWWAKLWVRVMYFFFRLSASLRIKNLVSPQQFLQASGLKKEREFKPMGGFIYSELWGM